MKLYAYLHYFFYITWQWNPWLAVFIIYHEIRGERKYHIDTIGEDELKSLKEKGVDISHATMYMPVSYYVLERLLKETIKYGGNKTFLDIGCGKGRAMIVAAKYGFEHISGIDFSKEYCEDAASATRQYSTENAAVHFSIIHKDAARYNIPKDITTIFMFNPFDEVIMGEVVSNIMKSQEQFPRTIRVLYVNPLHKSIFLDNGFTQLYYFKKLHYIEGVILQKEPQKVPQ